MLSPDLIIAMVFIAVVSVLAYIAGFRTSLTSGPVLLICSLSFAALFGQFFAGRLFWARFFPSSVAVYWCNFMPILIGFVAGVIHHSDGIRGWRLPTAILMFLGIALGYFALPIARPLVAPVKVESGGKWKGNICLQTHDSTCGAAAAATLLRLNGISTTESEMIRSCLTSEFGTEPLGLYRGLSKLSAGTNSRVSIASKHPRDWLPQNQVPNVALVRLNRLGNRNTLNRVLGGQEGHAVVVLGRNDDGHWKIADPAIGLVHWTDSQLDDRFTGEAMYLAN